MTNQITFNEMRQPVEGMPGCLFNGLAPSRPEHDTVEAWMAILTRLAEEQEQETRTTRDAGIGNATREIKLPLQKLAEGPWRSLGGYFDYTFWADRERFLELDKAIASGQDFREPDGGRDTELV